MPRRQTSSGVSSTRISRSSASISLRRALRKVVLPVDVPPDTRIVLRAPTAALRKAVQSRVSYRRLSSACEHLPPLRTRSRKCALCAIGIEAEARRDMLADGDCDRAAGRRRSDDLHPLTIRKVAARSGCSRLMPWFVMAAICRASRHRSASVRAGASCALQAPPRVSIHARPGG